MRPGLPAVLDVAGRQCVVVGAGAGGRRKIDALVAAGADVTVIDPVGLGGTGSDRAPRSEVEVIVRRWEPGDLQGAHLVVIATDIPDVNEAVAAEAESVGALVVRSDGVGVGHLTLPAVAQRASVRVAVDTGGGSPAVAAVLRDEIAHVLDAEGDRWDELARWAAERRPVSIAAVEARLAELRRTT
ncbi:MAG: bifunctional precorrin-2 dehydrogenase/sirohydrochlorin ferrochelatase [Actinomycetota bacterium]